MKKYTNPCGLKLLIVMYFSVFGISSFVVPRKIGEWDVRKDFSRREKHGERSGEADGKTVGNCISQVSTGETESVVYTY